jgi:hypothetical protein
VPGSANKREAAVRAAFASQAEWAERLGSPFTALLCATLASRLDRETQIGRRVLDWPGRPEAVADALALRLCGGLHGLVRRGDSLGLAAFYPPHPAPDEARLWAAIERTLRQCGEALRPWLDSAPQTNEVGRSALLMAGLMAVAQRFALPLDLLELGASAGLNLLLDRYFYDLGGVAAGDPASPLGLAPEWKGPPPPAGEVAVASRSGVDLRPMDPRRDRERLLAYVWPDQPARLARIEAALAIAAADPPAVERGDAAAWLDTRLAEPSAAGHVRVVLHSVAFQYFPAATQAHIRAAMEAAGAAAGSAAPLAWLRFEKLEQDEKYSLRLRVWPDGSDRLLAWSHPHGSAIRWVADAQG